MYFKVRIQGNPVEKASGGKKKCPQVLSRAYYVKQAHKEKDQELKRMRERVKQVQALIKAENYTPEIKLFVEEGFLDGPYKDLGLMEVEEFMRINLGGKE